MQKHDYMADKLLSLIARVMQVGESEVGEDANFETLKTWDSAREVELALMLEFEYGINVSDEELERLHSVADVRALLASRGIAAV